MLADSHKRHCCRFIHLFGQCITLANISSLTRLNTPTVIEIVNTYHFTVSKISHSIILDDFGEIISEMSVFVKPNEE